MAVNTGISAEAQHVLNSLEAHLNAVKQAAASAEASVVAHAERAWEDVREVLERWGGLQLSGAEPGAPEESTATGALPPPNNDVNDGSGSSA